MLTQPEPISPEQYRPTVKPAPPAPPPVYYLPPRRRIPCWLANAIESGSTEIPVIAYVLEDQYNIDSNGVRRLVIPAGTELHGIAQQTGMRERVIVTGAWTFVWRTADPTNNGRTLTVTGIALNRDYDERTGLYGPSDGSPGIAGERIESNDDKAIQSLALRFVSATTKSLESQQSMLNPLTSQIVSSTKPNIGNALLEGGAATLNGVAQQVDHIREQLEKDSIYIAVLPGKQFYLYTHDAIDLANATMPGQQPTQQQPRHVAAADLRSTLNIPSSP